MLRSSISGLSSIITTAVLFALTMIVIAILIFPAEQSESVQQDMMCRFVNECKKYGAVRQQCAVAGDFNNCIDIKMGKDLYGGLAILCTNDGQFRGDKTKVPSQIECFFRELFRGLRKLVD
jgi:hypothetical protein